MARGGFKFDAGLAEMRSIARRKMRKSLRLRAEAERAEAEAVALLEAAGPGSRTADLSERLDRADQLVASLLEEQR